MNGDDALLTAMEDLECALLGLLLTTNQPYNSPLHAKWAKVKAQVRLYRIKSKEVARRYRDLLADIKHGEWRRMNGR